MVQALVHFPQPEHIPPSLLVLSLLGKCLPLSYMIEGKKKKTLEGRPSEPHSHWSEVRSKRCCQLLPEGASQSLTSLLLHQL